MKSMTWTEWMEKNCATCRWGKSTSNRWWKWRCYSIGGQNEWRLGRFFKEGTFDCAEWEGKVKKEHLGPRECLESALREILAVIELEYYDKNLLSGDNKSRSEWKQTRLKDALRLLCDVYEDSE